MEPAKESTFIMRRNIFKNSHYPYSLQCSCIPSPTYKHAYAYPSTILARRTPQTSVAADSREGSKDFKTRMLRVTHSRVWFNIIKTLIPNTQRVQQNVKRGDNIKRSLFLSITFPSPNLLLSLKVILIPNPKGYKSNVYLHSTCNDTTPIPHSLVSCL